MLNYDLETKIQMEFQKKKKEPGQGVATVSTNPKSAVEKTTENNKPAEKGTEAERQRQLKVERKRLRQIHELEEKAAAGQALNPDQKAKMARKAEIEALVAQLEACMTSSN